MEASYSSTRPLLLRLFSIRSNGVPMLFCTAVRVFFCFFSPCVDHYPGTKYFGGHSDLLCGVLVVKTREEWVEVCRFCPLRDRKVLTVGRSALGSTHFPWQYDGFARIMASTTFITHTTPPRASPISKCLRAGSVAEQSRWGGFCFFVDRAIAHRTTSGQSPRRYSGRVD